MTGSRRRRWRRRALIAIVCVVVAFCAVTAPILVWPAQGMPARVDAIVMLAGPGDARLPAALALARAGRAGALVVSQGHLGYGGPCPPPVPGVRLICFNPDPSDTRGEAEFAGKIARQHGWRSLALVSTREQDTRARILVGRCFTGEIYVVTVARPWYYWPYQIAYGWGALLKALVVKRGC
jgi:hypothetical protein